MAAKPIAWFPPSNSVKGGTRTCATSNWDISSNAERIVAFLLAVTVLFALV